MRDYSHDVPVEHFIRVSHDVAHKWRQMVANQIAWLRQQLSDASTSKILWQSVYGHLVDDPVDQLLHVSNIEHFAEFFIDMWKNWWFIFLVYFKFVNFIMLSINFAFCWQTDSNQAYSVEVVEI